LTQNSSWRERYEQRIRSSQWKNMKRDLIRMRGDRCERCHLNVTLELHHKTYDRLGHEHLSDLELLCPRCHSIADAERAAAGRRRSATALHDAGLATFAEKKYGEDWESDRDYESVSEEYEQWLERNADEW
jgi:5-methylcytosine-specific restriction endonuclease McrA